MFLKISGLLYKCKINQKKLNELQQGEVNKMKELFLYGYEFLASFMPFLMAFALCVYLNKKKGVVISKAAIRTIVVFTVYILAVYHFTSAGTFYEGLRYQLKIQNDQLNFIPFSNDIDFVGYFLNIVLFVPLGILVPLVWKKMNKLTYILGTGLGFSLLIEVSQLLNNRRTDIDDLIMNTVGAMVGFALYKVFDKYTNSKYQLNDIPISLMLITILVTFIGRFLLFNEMGFARLLFGF